MTMFTTISFRWCLWMLSFTVFSKSEETCQTPTRSLFLTHPLDQTVKEGDNATFICSARNVHLEHVELFWEVYPDVYDRNTFTIIGREQLLITSKTTVFRIGKRGQTFRCLLKYSAGYYPELCYHSRVARTNVQFFPKNSQISCGPDLNNGLHEGDRIVLQCAAPRGNPPVDLRWTFDTLSDTDIALPVIREHGLQRTVTTNLEVNREMHLKTAVCQVTSEFAFPGVNSSCSLGPILVYQKPNVIVYPVQVTIEATNAMPLHFQCIARGFPEHFSYSWSCRPEDSICEYSERSSDILFLTAPSSKVTVTEFAKIYITCTVSNAIGSHNASSVIILQPPYNYEICTESNPTDNQLLRIDFNQETTNYPLHLTCSVHSDVANIDVNFTWYLNGKSILPVKRKVDNVSFPLSSVAIDDISSYEFGGVIFCKVSGIVGRKYITTGSCLVVKGNEKTSRRTPTVKDANLGYVTLLPSSSKHYSDLDLKVEPNSNMHNITGARTKLSDNNVTHVTLEQVKAITDADEEHDIVKTNNENITLLTWRTFCILHGNVLILATTVLLIIAVLTALFIFKNRGTFNAPTLPTSGSPEEGDESSWMDQLYEVPSVRWTSAEEIALDHDSSIRSASLCSAYAEGFDGKRTDSSSSNYPSTSSWECDETL